MPSGLLYWGPNLTQAVENGTIPESRLDDMATRVMATWFLTNQNSGTFPARGVGMPANLLAPHPVVNARNPAASAGLMQAAIEGHVLVKNTNNALPLKSPQLLSVYGYDAKPPNVNVPAPGLAAWSLGLESTDLKAVLCGFSATFGPCTTFLPYAPNGTIVTGGGSGATTPAYISDPLSAIQARAMDNNIEVFWDTETVNSTSSVSGTTDACLVFINAESSEGIDRPALYDSFSDNLVNNIAKQCNNTIVVIHNAGIRLVDNFVNHPNVTAILFAHLPGQDSGRALTQILFGDISPSGKLPYTVAKNESDYGALLSPTPTPPIGSQYALFPQSNFTEGLLIDYRAFDAQNITPRYEFGFGLTYTTFAYSNLLTTKSITGSNSTLPTYPTGAIISGGHADLFDNVLQVTATITNTGSVAAAEIAQLYISIPAAGQPIRQLRGFEKVYLTPGASATVTFPLQRRDLSVWDVGAQNWKLITGSAYTVSVGASSRNLPLTSTFTL